MHQGLDGLAHVAACHDHRSGHEETLGPGETRRERNGAYAQAGRSERVALKTLEDCNAASAKGRPMSGPGGLSPLKSTMPSFPERRGLNPPRFWRSDLANRVGPSSNWDGRVADPIGFSRARSEGVSLSTLGDGVTRMKEKALSDPEHARHDAQVENST